MQTATETIGSLQIETLVDINSLLDYAEMHHVQVLQRSVFGQMAKRTRQRINRDEMADCGPLMRCLIGVLENLHRIDDYNKWKAERRAPQPSKGLASSLCHTIPTHRQPVLAIVILRASYVDSMYLGWKMQRCTACSIKFALTCLSL